MRFQDKRVTFGSKISDRVWKDNNGQLICHDCILARTGCYDYLESDILVDGDPTKIVQVYRTPEEVFDPTSIASFENKPFCNDHPDEDVTPLNYKDLQVGYIRNIRRGVGDLDNCLIGDIIVTDQDVIDLILSGEKRQLSLGYDSIIEKDESGRYQMKKIRGNHLALVDEGRAGCATIRDNSTVKYKFGGKRMKRGLFNTRAKLYDEDIIEVEEIDEETPIISEETTDDDYELEEVKTEQMEDDETTSLEEIVKRLEAIEQRLSNLEGTTTDEDTTEEITEENIEENVEDEDDVEEITDDCDTENTLLDADEEIEEIIEKKKDRAVSTYSKFANMKDSMKNQDKAIEQASREAWKKRYGIK